MNGRLLRMTLVLALTGCQSPTASAPPVEVTSLQEVLPALLEAARDWRSDAFLAEADLPLTDVEYQGPIAYAGFQSPEEDGESLLVKLNRDGTVSAQSIVQTPPIRKRQPILFDQSMLDSGEALNRALEFAGRDAWTLARSGCSFLGLGRDLSVDQTPVTWMLTLTDCDAKDVVQVEIDAHSGALVFLRDYSLPATETLPSR
jgi:hypothetical protein